MQKCSLCGGKVVNGRCQECGMPIPDENRYILRSQTGRAQPDKRREDARRTRQTTSRDQGTPAHGQPLYRQRNGRRAAPKSLNKQRQAGAAVKRVIWGIIFFVLALNVIQWILAAATL